MMQLAGKDEDSPPLRRVEEGCILDLQEEKGRDSS